MIFQDDFQTFDTSKWWKSGVDWKGVSDTMAYFTGSYADTMATRVLISLLCLRRMRRVAARFTWGANFKVAAGAVNTAASKVSTLRFVYDGTNWVQTGGVVI